MCYPDRVATLISYQDYHKTCSLFVCATPRATGRRVGGPSRTLLPQVERLERLQAPRRRTVQLQTQQDEGQRRHRRGCSCRHSADVGGGGDGAAAPSRRGAARPVRRWWWLAQHQPRSKLGDGRWDGVRRRPTGLRSMGVRSTRAALRGCAPQGSLHEGCSTRVRSTGRVASIFYANVRSILMI